MKGEKYLGKFASKVKENFDYEEISDLWTSYEGEEISEWMAVHKAYYKGGGYDFVEAYVKNDEIIGVRIVDPTSGKILFQAGEMVKTK